MKKIKEFIYNIIHFLEKDIWWYQQKEFSTTRQFLFRLLKIVLISLRSFGDGRIWVRAASLTYYTILSIIPFVALAFGIAKGFWLEEYLDQLMLQQFAAHQEVMNQIITFAKKYLETTNGGIIAGVGFAFMLWYVMKVLNSIERTFNEIWQVKKSRSLDRKFSDYFAIVILAPVIMVLSGSATLFLTSEVQTLASQSELFKYLSPLLLFFLKLVPYILIWILLMLIYLIIPNTKVTLKSALVAGIVAGTMYQVVQWIYITFQVGFSKYNAIYGSLAALPLFLIWIQTSWMIVLYGAEISFAYQNVDRYGFEKETSLISTKFKRLLSLIILHRFVINFKNGEKPITVSEIATFFQMPYRIANSIIHELQGCGLLTETTTTEYKQVAYQPARDINSITVSSVWNALDQKGLDDIPHMVTDEEKKMDSVLKKYEQMMDESKENVLIKDIL